MIGKRVSGLSMAVCLLLLFTVCPGLLADGYPVLLVREGVPVQIEREEIIPAAIRASAPSADADLTARLAGVVRAQIAGPTAEEMEAGFRGIFPPGCAVDSVEVRRSQALVRITVTEEFVTDVLDEMLFEQMVSLTVDWGNHLQGLRSLSLEARLEGESDYFPLQEFLPPPPPEVEKPVEEIDSISVLEVAPIRTAALAGGQMPTRGQPQPAGALSGASVFLSPGHGWYYSSTLGRWATQRGNTNNIIEDLSNGEAVLQNLTHYLWNAGARVYTCRERDLQTNMVIVDNGGSGYSEAGTWTTQVPSAGFYGSNVREAATVTGAPTATATFTPTIPEDGFYAVYVHQRGSTAGTTTADARYTVNHTGGSTTWVQNQAHDGWTWKYIGTFHFEAGTGGSVVIDNLSATAGRYVVADAVRVGGGMGDYADGGSVSGWPRWEESGKYFAGFMGHTYSNGTVGAMPLYADWECEDSWEGGTNYNAVYVAWHTNAPDPGTGTSSFAYSSAGWGGTFDGVTGGLQLRDAIHNELINDIRAGWDASWYNRGATTANFGEINPSNNNDMPASLHEIGFHDTAADAEDLEDPDFRRLAARAVYQGIVKFYHDYFYAVRGNSEFSDDTLLPEPPTNLRVEATGSSSALVSWAAPPYDSGNGLLGDAATGYRVYRSSNGRGFDNGTDVTGTSTTISGLTPGEVVYIQVSASNSGGESFPTETLAVSVPSSGSASVLIVNGFDRIDRFLNVIEDDPYSTADLHRGYLWLMNTRDYIIAHAEAIDPLGISFDSCANEAIIDGQIDLGDYETVVWILGNESIADQTFSSTEQSAVTSYLSGGGKLFVSGAEIGWDLESQGNGVTFFNSTLRADYLSDDAGVYSASGATGTIFDGISLSFDDGSSIYNVEYPDTLAGINGSVVCMTYSASGSPGAAIQYPSGTTGGQIVMLGFPFETITTATARNQVMAAAMSFFDTGGGDTTPPAAPSGLGATGGDGQAVLDWTDNGEADLAGYNVYRSTTSGSGYSQINGSLVATSDYTDTSVTNGTTYYYVVTAVDTSTNESGNSSEASATPASGATEVIVDNDDGSPAYTETGTWTTSGSAGYDGGTYRYTTAGVAATATWNATLSAAGDYQVSVIYRAGTNRATSTRYEIATASGTQVATIDQTQTDLIWVPLGTYAFNAGATSITLDAAGSSGGSVVVADAVRFTPAGQIPQDPAEMRIAIITLFDDVNDTTSIQSWVNEIAGLNYNAIAIHARYRGDASYFPNKTDSTYPNSEPRSSAAGSIDVLEEFTTRGHAAGLMVLAYVNTQLVTDGSDTNPNPTHIVNTHPEWITYYYNGGSPVVQTTAYEPEGRWIDPGIPASRQYVANICGDIMMNYDCDGIILDRIRYPQTNWSRTTDFGYHPTSIAAFNAQFGKSGIPNPSDPDWILFRQQQITAQVQEVYSTITAIDPDHILLAYPIGRFSDAINYNYQDWPTWLSSGVIDGVLPQIYTTDNTTFSSRCDEHIAAYSGPRLLGVTTLAYTAGVDMDGQIEITRTKGMAGTSPFRHGSMEALGYFTDLANAYANNAPWPDMPWKASDTVPPAAPTGLQATAGNGQVSLDWDDNSEMDLDGYNVHRATVTGGPYTQLNASLVASSAYVDSTASNGTTYYYVVTAVDTSVNESGNSSEVSATPQDTTPPAAPTGLVATGGDGQVSLDWADNGEGDLAGYNVYRSTTSGSGYTQINGSLVASSAYVDSTAVNFTTYYYVVTAVDANTNESANSGEDSATPQDTTPPAAPTGLAATAGDGQVSLNWNDNGESDLGGYNVYRSTTSGSGYAQINGSLVTSSDYTDNTAANFTTYYYVVTAVDNTPNANESVDSSEVSATPQDTTPPAAPTGLSASAGNGHVSLDWNDNGESDLGGYNVYRSTTSGSGYAQINGSLVTSSDYTDNTAANFTTYYYVVTAVDNTPNANESGNSSEVSATPQDTTPPAVPTGLTATAGNGLVSLDWADNSEPDLAGYNVYRSTTSGSGYAQINGSLLTSSDYVDNTVSNGTTYYYVVTAVDSTPNANESGNSAEASGTPADVTNIRIEVEDYDTGGEGVGYHDTTAGNSGAVYRTDDVDIEASSQGGYNVGWIAAGEWLQFSNVIGNGGSYDITVSVASLSAGGTFHIEVNGEDVTGAVSFDATGGYQIWTTIDAGTLTLTSGSNTIRFVMDTAGFNVDWFDLDARDTSGTLDLDTLTMASYGGQDVNPSSFDLIDGGQIAHMYGNTWKRFTLNCSVTQYTVIEFDYKSDSTEPEIGGIGFDNDDTLSPDLAWKVFGTQAWGITTYDNYALSGNGWTHYTIPVGQTLTAGTYSYLVLINDFDGGTGSNSYIRDIRIYEDTPSEIIVDNDDGSPGYTTTGTWTLSGSSGYDGGTYEWANAGQSHTATWTLDVPAAGNWRVDVIYRASTNRATSVEYNVQTAGGNQATYVDQTQNNLTWVTLGTWAFNSGSTTVTLDSADSSGGSVVIADAVRFTQIP